MVSLYSNCASLDSPKSFRILSSSSLTLAVCASLVPPLFVSLLKVSSTFTRTGKTTRLVMVNCTAAWIQSSSNPAFFFYRTSFYFALNRFPTTLKSSVDLVSLPWILPWSSIFTARLTPPWCAGLPCWTVLVDPTTFCVMPSWVSCILLLPDQARPTPLECKWYTSRIHCYYISANTAFFLVLALFPWLPMLIQPNMTWTCT